MAELQITHPDVGVTQALAGLDLRLAEGAVSVANGNPPLCAVVELGNDVTVKIS